MLTHVHVLVQKQNPKSKNNLKTETTLSWQVLVLVHSTVLQRRRFRYLVVHFVLLLLNLVSLLFT